LLAAGCDPAYAQQQVGHTDPTLTLRTYQQLLKRKRRKEYRDRVDELLGTSRAALSRLPDLSGGAKLGPKSGPNSLLQAAGGNSQHGGVPAEKACKYAASGGG
jgi:hypothetical protein